MVNKYCYQIAIGSLILFFLSACCPDDQKSVGGKSKKTTLKESKVNPNGDSELALLMRLMYDQSDSIRQIIIDGGELLSRDLIAKFEEIHTAIPTDPDVRDDGFSAFSNQIVQDMNRIWDADTGRVEQFNLFVDRCIQCHTVYCPGPIKKIQRLKIR